MIWALLFGAPAAILGPPPGLAVQAAPDTLYSGCGGGYTGGGSGLVIASSGTIGRWRRSRAGQPRAIVRAWTDTAGAARVFRAAQAARFRTVPPGKVSNWTCHFRLVDGDGTHEVPYSGTLPPALRELDSLVQALGRDAPER